MTGKIHAVMLSHGLISQVRAVSTDMKYFRLMFWKIKAVFIRQTAQRCCVMLSHIIFILKYCLYLWKRINGQKSGLPLSSSIYPVNITSGRQYITAYWLHKRFTKCINPFQQYQHQTASLLATSIRLVKNVLWASKSEDVFQQPRWHWSERHCWLSGGCPTCLNVEFYMHQTCHMSEIWPKPDWNTFQKYHTRNTVVFSVNDTWPSAPGSVLFCSLAVLDPRVGHTIQAVRGLYCLRAPGIVPRFISFSRKSPCFLMVWP